jgi:hypothetical protein
MNPNYPAAANQQALYQQMLLAQQAGGMTQAQAAAQQQQRQLLQQQQQQQAQPRGAVGLGTSSRGPAATMSAAEQQRQIAMFNQFAVRQQQQQQQQQIGYAQLQQQQGGVTVPAVASAPQPAAPAPAPQSQPPPAAAATATPQQPQAPPAISTELLQTYLDENQMLLEAIVQQQNHGKLQNTLQYQLKLQQNLLFLATLADANPPKF